MCPAGFSVDFRLLAALIASDDDAYAHIGFHLANDIRNQSPASEVLLTLCGWNIDTLLDKTPPIAIED